MRTWLNKHFGFSKGEFNGLLFLTMLIVLLKTIPFVYNLYKPVDQDDPNLLAALQKITFTDQESYHYTKDHIEDANNKRVSKLFKFDPNTINVSDWQTLGLSLKQAQSIVNYRNKGGKFYKAEDLQKMYSISAEMYKRLYPYIEIAAQNNTYPKRDFQYEKKEYVQKPVAIIEINQADSAQLNEIKGIGPAFAMRILKYRTRLGGFYKKEQLMEVYGLDSVKFNEIKDQVIVNREYVKTININTADFNDLKSSPYLSYKQINAIIQYRKQHGNYSNAEDLKKIAILTPLIIEKLMPYLAY
jgi:DNA uptake protein ComE-like DNA-binding protein